jgi:hypothetical protein
MWHETDFRVEQVQGCTGSVIESRGRAYQPLPPIHGTIHAVSKVHLELNRLPSGIRKPIDGKRRPMVPLQVVLKFTAGRIHILHPAGVPLVFRAGAKTMDNHGTIRLTSSQAEQKRPKSFVG